MRRAFTLLFKRTDDLLPVAEVVHVESGVYVSYDFNDWAELSAYASQSNGAEHDWIRTVRLRLMVPRIVRVLGFGKVPRQAVKFNRRNLLARDNSTCQYCLRRLPALELTLDHVVPRSQGGATTWENVVCACHRCNVRKGGRTPSQAGLRLGLAPARPKCNPILNGRLGEKRYAAWQPFLEQARWDVQSA